jgi:hypothetical protein
MLARRVARRAMHKKNGEPNLPDTVRRRDSFGMMLLLAGVAGTLLALGDVLKEQQQNVAQRA